MTNRYPIHIPHSASVFSIPSISPTPTHTAHPQLYQYDSTQKGSKHPFKMQPIPHFQLILYWFGIILFHPKKNPSCKSLPNPDRRGLGTSLKYKLSPIFSTNSSLKAIPHVKMWHCSQCSQFQHCSQFYVALQLVTLSFQPQQAKPPLDKSFTPTLAEQVPNSSLLYGSTTAFACIFFSILNHSQANQKNSIIIKG